MTPTTEEQPSTSTHLAGRATYTTNTLHILLIQNHNPWASPPSKPGGLGPPTGGLHRRITTPTHRRINIPRNKHPHPLISPGGQHTLPTHYIYYLYKTTILGHHHLQNQEDWDHLQEDYTGGSPHQHTGGSIYLVIVIYIVSCIV